MGAERLGMVASGDKWGNVKGVKETVTMVTKWWRGLTELCDVLRVVKIYGNAGKGSVDQWKVTMQKREGEK